MKTNQLTGADYLAARTHIGLSISAVAKLTSINRNTLSQFEQEKTKLGSEAKKQLVTFYQERGYNFNEPQEPNHGAIAKRYDAAQTNVVDSVVEKRSMDELSQAVLALADTTHDVMSVLINGAPESEQELETIELPDSYLHTHDMLQGHFTLDGQGEHQGKVGFFKESADERSEKLIALMAQQYMRILQAEMPDTMSLERDELHDDSDQARVLDKLQEWLDHDVLNELAVQ